MFVILEGPDGAGKTSFANALAERVFTYTQHEPIRLHRGPIKESPLSEYLYCVDQVYRPGDNIHIICDRWHWGELIYGPLYRGRSQLTISERYLIDQWLRTNGALIVHLTNIRDVLLKRHQNTHEDFLKPEHVQHVIESYDDVAKTSIVNTITYRDNHTMADVNDVYTISSILEAAAARNRKATR